MMRKIFFVLSLVTITSCTISTPSSNFSVSKLGFESQTYNNLNQKRRPVDNLPYIEPQSYKQVYKALGYKQVPENLGESFVAPEYVEDNTIESRRQLKIASANVPEKPKSDDNKQKSFFDRLFGSSQNNTDSQIKSDESFKNKSEDAYGLVRDLRPASKKDEGSFKNGNWHNKVVEKQEEKTTTYNFSQDKQEMPVKEEVKTNNVHKDKYRPIADVPEKPKHLQDKKKLDNNTTKTIEELDKKVSNLNEHKKTNFVPAKSVNEPKIEEVKPIKIEEKQVAVKPNVDKKVENKKDEVKSSINFNTKQDNKIVDDKKPAVSTTAPPKVTQPVLPVKAPEVPAPKPEIEIRSNNQMPNEKISSDLGVIKGKKAKEYDATIKEQEVAPKINLDSKDISPSEKPPVILSPKVMPLPAPAKPALPPLVVSPPVVSKPLAPAPSLSSEPQSSVIESDIGKISGSKAGAYNEEIKNNDIKIPMPSLPNTNNKTAPIPGKP